MCSVKLGKIKKEVASSYEDHYINENANKNTLKYYKALWICVLAIFGFLIYWQTAYFEFALDDVIVYSQNEFVLKGSKGIRDILFNESFLGYFKEQKSLLIGGRYRPLSIISFAIEYQLWGANPGRAHILNLILYVLNCILIGILFLKIWSKEFSVKKALLLSGILSLLFLAYPIHTEVVANIKGRDEILCLLFSMLSLLFLIQKSKNRISLDNLFYLGFFLCALLSKENAVILVISAPLLAYYQSEQRDKKRAVLICFEYLGILLFYLWLRYLACGFLLNSDIIESQGDLMNNPYFGLTFFEKLPNIFAIIFHYVRLLVFPLWLTHDYYPWQIPLQSWGSSVVWGGILVFILFVFCCFYTLINRNNTFFYYCWIGSSILLISNLFINIGTILNERFLYFPSLGFLALIIYTLGKNNNFEKLKNWFLFLSALLFFAFIFISVKRVPAWKNNTTLNEASIKISKNSARANLFYGVNFFNKYQQSNDPNIRYKYLDTAEIYILRSVEILPEYSTSLNMLAGVAGEKYQKNHSIDPLIQTFKLVLERYPDITYIPSFVNYLKSSSHDQALIKMYLDATFECISKGKFSQAQKLKNQALQLFPENQILKSIEIK